MFERIRHMLIKEFIQVFRDPRMRAVILIMPCMEVLVIGYAVNMDIRDIRTAVYDLDNTPASRELLARFSSSGYFDVVARVDDDRRMQDLIDRSSGADRAADQPRLRRRPGGRADRRPAGDLRRHRFQHGGHRHELRQPHHQRLCRPDACPADRARPRRGQPAGADRFPPRAWFNENLDSRNYFVPGVIVIVVSLVSLLLTSMAVVREKEIGTIEQIMVTPITPAEFILGKTLPFVVISYVDVTLILLIGVFWFGVPLRGSILLLYFSTGLYLLTMLGMGLLISTVSQTQQQALMSTFLFFFPAMLLSGFSFPIANMPPVIQWLTFLNPVAYYLVIVRTIFLKGIGLAYLWPHLLALAVMGVGTLVLAVRRFHKTL